MDPHYMEWLNLTIRWVHMITGIAWIGASFYFVWLENNLDRRNPRAGLAGDLWAIHGGGIYHLEKYQLAPPKLPEQLHWFKWEAYTTWISGMLLLIVVYYLQPQLYLLAPDSAIGPGMAVVIGLVSLIAGWLVYDRLCESALGRLPGALGLILFVLLVGSAYALAQVFSGRGAFIHLGAMIGTLMAGNVFRVIMPAQRDLVRAIERGVPPDPNLPAKGLQRSRHNNYLTLPVLFIMISNHFPSTYGHPYNWAVLAALSVLSVLVRHYFNTRHTGQQYAWTLPAAALGMLALAFVFKPAPSTPATGAVKEQTAGMFLRAQQIIAQRCTPCHSAAPSHPGFASAPAGVLLDTPAQMRQWSTQIYSQAVATRSMPLGNLTQMTAEEREVLAGWIREISPIGK